MSSENESTPAKQQKLDSTPSQKSALEILADLTAENNDNDNEDGKNQYGLDLHGKSIDEMNELLKLKDLSKNQYKKIIRYRTYLEKAPERRVKKKIKQKGHQRKLKHKKIASKENLELNFHLGLDLKLDDLMSSKNLSDLSRQMQWLYMVNKHHDFSTQIWFCGREKRLEEVVKYQHSGEANWDVHWFDQEFTELPHKKEDVVYLSSDSETILRKVEPGKIYMIGGLVDRNSHKGHCHKRAEELGYSTAKLPLQDFVDFKELTRPLTVNHVAEIVTRVVNEVCKAHNENNEISYSDLELKGVREGYKGIPAGLNPEKPNNVKIDSIDQTKFWEEAIITTLPKRRSVKVKNIEDASNGDDNVEVTGDKEDKEDNEDKEDCVENKQILINPE